MSAGRRLRRVGACPEGLMRLSRLGESKSFLREGLLGDPQTMAAGDWLRLAGSPLASNDKETKTNHDQGQTCENKNRTDDGSAILWCFVQTSQKYKYYVLINPSF